jgi:hypothetical protein
MRKSPSDDDYDRRSRLVGLVYEVLRDIKMPEDATDRERLLLLCRAFSDKATAPAKPEAREPKGREATLTYMYSVA